MISKLVDEVNYMSTWGFMSTQGQGHLLILVLVAQIFLIFLSNRLADWNQISFGKIF